MSLSPQPITGLFYSGFLTENGERRAELIHEATDDWGKSVSAFVGGRASLQRVHWSARQVAHLVPTVEQLNARKVGLIFGSLMHTIDNWSAAVSAADREIDALTAWLDERHDQPVLLIGHSLGARIILKAAMRAKHRHAHVVALAPALPVKDFDVVSLDSPYRSVDIFYSPTDSALKWAYPFGQSTSREDGAVQVLGQLGLPKEVKLPVNIHLHDVVRILKREKFSHADYAAALPLLAKHSRVLHHLDKGARPDSWWNRVGNLLG